MNRNEVANIIEQIPRGLSPDDFLMALANKAEAVGKQNREWVGLTDEEIDTWNIVGHESLREFVRSIEAKLKEKNA